MVKYMILITNVNVMMIIKVIQMNTIDKINTSKIMNYNNNLDSNHYNSKTYCRQQKLCTILLLKKFLSCISEGG